MANTSKEDTLTIDISRIGYFGRPIKDLSRDELLSAFAELVDTNKEVKRKNEKCKEILGEKRFESL